MSMRKRINDKAQDAYKNLRTSVAFKDLFKKDNGDLTQDAEIVLKTLSKFCNSDRSSVVLNLTSSIDPLQLAFNEGKRAVYLFILRKLKVTDKEIKDFFEEIE